MSNRKTQLETELETQMKQLSAAAGRETPAEELEGRIKAGLVMLREAGKPGAKTTPWYLDRIAGFTVRLVEELRRELHNQRGEPISAYAHNRVDSGAEHHDLGGERF